VWVAANIDRWKDDNPVWLSIDIIDDEFLPEAVIEAEGGKYHRRSSVTMQIMGGLDNKAPIIK